MSSSSDDDPGRTMIGRVVAILEVFDRQQPVLSAAEISRRTGLPIATTYRVVNEMVSRGLLDRTNDGFTTGVRLWELALRGSRPLTLRNVALPFMEEVQSVVRQHTQLAILEGTDILYIERLSAHSAVINIQRIAGRLPARICSSGMLLTAFAEPDVQRRILAAPIDIDYLHAVVEPADVRHLFSQARRELYVKAEGWIDVTSAGVAVPIRDADSTVIAALSVTVPNVGMTVLRAVPHLLTAAMGISRALGWVPMSERRKVSV